MYLRLESSLHYFECVGLVGKVLETAVPTVGN